MTLRFQPPRPVRWTLVALAAPVLLLAAAPGTPPYQDASIPADQRVADLLSRMTLEEKVAQVTALWNKSGLSDEKGAFAPTRRRPRSRTGSARSRARARPATRAVRAPASAVPARAAGS